MIPRTAALLWIRKVIMDEAPMARSGYWLAKSRALVNSGTCWSG